MNNLLDLDRLPTNITTTPTTEDFQRANREEGG